MPGKLTVRLTDRDEEAMQRIRARIGRQNPYLARQGVSDAAVIRYCLMACDPKEERDA